MEIFFRAGNRTLESLIFPREAEGGTELENQIWMEEPARLWNR